MMLALALIIAAYAFYGLFSAENGAELALALVRVAIAAFGVIALTGHGGVMISAALFVNVAAVLVAMAILRKEVQLPEKNDGGEE